MKLCVECKYYTPDPTWSDRDLMRRYALCGRYPSPIDGWPQKHCADERSRWFGGCGRDAKLFEPKS